MNASGQTKKLLKSKSGLRIVSIRDDDESPFELSEPPWALDRESSHCDQCQSKFDFLTRRPMDPKREVLPMQHHCRRCGHVYCGTCCGQRLPLQRMCFVDPVRICNTCRPATLRENDFYERHLQVLLRGAKFLVSQQESPGNNARTCRLTANHRDIVVDGPEPLNIPLLGVHTFRMLRDTPAEESSVPTGALLGCGDRGTLHLHVLPCSDSTSSIQWLVALYKALKMISDGPP